MKLQIPDLSIFVYFRITAKLSHCGFLHFVPFLTKKPCCPAGGVYVCSGIVSACHLEDWIYGSNPA
jgi:hypothetical protein